MPLLCFAKFQFSEIVPQEKDSTINSHGHPPTAHFAKILSKIYNFNDDIATIFNMKIEEAFKRYAENGYIA